MMTTIPPPQDLEGLFPDYEYYPNNFTIYDSPAHVYPKYVVIVKPKIAYLNNGLPERSDYNDAYNLYVTLEIILITLLDLGIQIPCWWTVQKHKGLSRSVKWFLLSDTALRIFADVNGLLKAQCNLSWSCVNYGGYPFSWLTLNQIMSTINVGSYHVSQSLALGLSINRIFAIFFNGLHYGRVERLAIPYIGIVFLAFEGWYLSTMGKKKSTYTGVSYYVGYFYSPLGYITTATGYYYPLAFEILRNFAYVGYAVTALSFALDLLTFWRIRQMVITTHLLSCLSMLYSQINSLLLLSFVEPLTLFLVDMPQQFFPIITGATIAAFNYPYKKKDKKNRVLNQDGNQRTVQPAPTQSTSISRGNEETQMTKVD